MSTHDIDDILAKKAEEEMDRWSSAACRTFDALLKEFSAGVSLDSRDQLTLLLTEIIHDLYHREHMTEWQLDEGMNHTLRRGMTSTLQKTMAKELLERIDQLEMDVTELRDDFTG